MVDAPTDAAESLVSSSNTTQPAGEYAGSHRNMHHDQRQELACVLPRLYLDRYDRSEGFIPSLEPQNTCRSCSNQDLEGRVETYQHPSTSSKTHIKIKKEHGTCGQHGIFSSLVLR